jgi:hypothetical protein
VISSQILGLQGEQQGLRIEEDEQKKKKKNSSIATKLRVISPFIPQVSDYKCR